MAFQSIQRTSPRGGAALAGAAILVLAAILGTGSLATPASVAAFHGAVYTSDIDGSEVNGNHYDHAVDVYLTGGPCKGGTSLDAGRYYFEVSDPSGKESLAVTGDPISHRVFTVDARGHVAAAAGSDHAVAAIPATADCRPGGSTMQIWPFKETPNHGGVYKLTVATAESVEAAEDFKPTATSFLGYEKLDAKTDVFKVTVTAATIPTTTATVVAPTSVTLGGSVTDTATVTGTAEGGWPKGDVVFYLCDGSTCPTGGRLVATEQLKKASGADAADASVTYTSTTTGTFTFRAEYVPRANEPYAASKDSGANETFAVVGPGATPTPTPGGGTTGTTVGPRWGLASPSGEVLGVTSELPATDLAAERSRADLAVPLALAMLGAVLAIALLIPLRPRARKTRR